MAGSFTDPAPVLPLGGHVGSQPPPPSGARRRTLEIWTALGVALFGAIVAGESLTHDVGWSATTGPGAGYFPFRIGLLLVGASVVLLLQYARAPAATVFATRDEMRRSLSVFLPAAVLVAAMFPLGCYVPSAAYLAWMMRRHGGCGRLAAIAAGAAVMTVFFVIFDLWFRVPLAKGPIEAALGLY
jgi:putative tricarboxylic transport membrane protein